jgi:hypothetical protein
MVKIMPITRKQFYAVSAAGIGLLAGTLARSRRESIRLFQLGCPPGSFALDWNRAKHAGYRTVRAVVEIHDRFGTRRTTRR